MKVKVIKLDLSDMGAQGLVEALAGLLGAVASQEEPRVGGSVESPSEVAGPKADQETNAPEPEAASTDPRASVPNNLSAAFATHAAIFADAGAPAQASRYARAIAAVDSAIAALRDLPREATCKCPVCRRVDQAIEVLGGAL